MSLYTIGLDRHPRILNDTWCYTVISGAFGWERGRVHLVYQTTIHYAAALTFWYAIRERSVGDLQSVVLELKTSHVVLWLATAAAGKRKS